MNTTVLSVLIVVLTVAAIAALYLWDRQAKRRAIADLGREDLEDPRLGDLGDPLGLDAGTDDVSEPRQQTFAGLEPTMTAERAGGEATPLEESIATPDNRPPPPLVQEKIIQLSVVGPKARPFSAVAIHEAATEVGLAYNPIGCFDRLGDDGRTPLFSIASLVEPGVVPEVGDSQFRTPGLLLFLRLPGSEEGVVWFSDMLYTAQRLSALLHGELRDQDHSTLTKQTIDHLRGEIAEHLRQARLAQMRKRQ